ncbi:hypothetical protein AAC387_Pa12g1278 [Persea americana]
MAIGLVAAFASPSPTFIGSSHCRFCNMEGFCCSLLPGIGTGWISPVFENRRVFDVFSMRCKNPLFGGVPSHLWTTGPESSLPKVRVASDYSDSVPNSSNYMGNRGYHPLEEVKDSDRNKEKMLTDAEIARTTVEANNSALLVFPGMVHCEPHGHISWAEFQYVLDDFGDIFIEIFDDENILQDRGASNPVNVFIGMDHPIHGKNRRVIGNHIDNLASGVSDNFSFDEDEEEIGDTEVSGTLIDWGMPDTMRRIHPMYFAKCLTKVVHTKYGKKMDHPSNGISIMGCLRPAFIDEESYLRRLFHGEDGDGYISDWSEESEKEEEQVAAAFNLIDGEILKFNSKDYGASISSTLYKLEIMRIELFSVYGDQSMVSLQDFQEAEPDVLVHSASTILERFTEYGMKCDNALKALCRKKKGLHVEGANLIGVDSLGMDVRTFSGVEAQTLRFSFNARATSESAAEKKIRRMLFPRYYRKNFKSPSDNHGGSDSF